MLRNTAIYAERSADRDAMGGRLQFPSDPPGEPNADAEGTMMGSEMMGMGGPAEVPADPAAEEAGTASEPPIEMMAGGMASEMSPDAENPPQAEDPTKNPVYVGGFSMPIAAAPISPWETAAFDTRARRLTSRSTNSSATSAPRAIVG